MKIEVATRKTVEDVAPLFDEYRQFYGQASDLEGALRFLKQRVKNGESTIFLARENGRPVGFAQLYPSFSSVSIQPLWILNDLFVTPYARGRRVATALLKKSKTLAEKTNSKGLILTTRTNNIEAQRLYEKQGWERDELFYSYFLDV